MALGKKMIDPFSLTDMEPKDTGVPLMIWAVESAGRTCCPFLYVSRILRRTMNVSTLVIISIEDDPKELSEPKLSKREIDLLKIFIKTNQKVLVDYWYGRESTPGLFRYLKPIVSDKS